MLEFAKQDNKEVFFIKPSYNEFWGKKCIKNNVSCLTCEKKKINFQIQNKIEKQKYDFLGIYLYLDHIENLSTFIKTIFKNSQSIGIILEKNNKFTKKKSCAIQHFTAWDNSSMKFLSKKYNFYLNNNFKKIKGSGNEFYLFTKFSLKK